jgi:hypothetical protein
MKCFAQITAGVCGFQTKVSAVSADDQIVTLTLETDCAKIAQLAERLKGLPLDTYDEIATGYSGIILTTARETLSGCCAGCVVPPGIFKAVQVAARVALPREAAIELAVEE